MTTGHQDSVLLITLLTSKWVSRHQHRDHSVTGGRARHTVTKQGHRGQGLTCRRGGSWDLASQQLVQGRPLAVPAVPQRSQRQTQTTVTLFTWSFEVSQFRNLTLSCYRNISISIKTLFLKKVLTRVHPGWRLRTSWCGALGGRVGTEPPAGPRAPLRELLPGGHSQEITRCPSCRRVRIWKFTHRDPGSPGPVS